MMIDNDTIAAIATPAGMGGVGVIRVSGSQALSIARTVTGKKILTPRYAHYANFSDSNHTVIDQGIVIYFNAPHSYTGEDVVEFQGHGGVYVLQSVLKLILSLGARQARPGEFSERAFLNDKMDLIQAEAVADLIESRSQSATTAALRSLSGQFSAVIEDLQASIITLRVYVEAALDFSEEEIDFLSDGKVKEKINALQKKVRATQQKAGYGKLLHDGVQVVLVGEPNVGKSSLMNQLLGQDRAIVTDEAGTTRDTLQETLLIRQIPVNITDTAGLREADNMVEKVGIARAKAAVQSADLAIWLRDGSTLSDKRPDELAQVDFIEVHNKADLLTADDLPVQKISDEVITISAKTGQGIDVLIEKIADKIIGKHSEEGVFSARERHINALQQARQHIDTASDFIQSLATAELVAEELRLAHNALGEMTGDYRSDDLLGAIFSSFCVGK
ncbi:MAG: tRNA uridine-5-carboxymethylaminomethyl(34) synthesis GTPase MnmE [Gammaproteobacteria bacterium]|nr:MAG: tRNA uridine-5-carboxymethylaminomethyl(34) synthesis GTPase MnmE [Gammaproteobacteria bacterium]